MSGWLIRGLREVQKIARERPDLVRRVREHPSGFLSTKEAMKEVDIEQLNEADIERELADFKSDREDKRCLQGKYTPDPGVCRVCGDKVVAKIAARDDGRIGGPPSPCYIASWYCQGCKIVYQSRPAAVGKR